MRIIKNIILISLLFAIILVSLFFGEKWVRTNVKNQAIVYNSQLNPMVMIPGSSANNHRFDNLVAILNRQSTTHSLLRVQVNEDNSISYSGRIRPNDSQPYIVIGFQNNSDGYANIKRQAKWLEIAMKFLQKRYHFNHFNAFGHSNGGLDWTIYLEKYFNQKSSTIGTLMTVGSPFNFSEKSESNRTQMLTDLIKNRSKLPRDMTVYSIAGTETYNDDGIVPIESVLLGKYVFQKNVHSYTQITVSGNDSEHSDLPTNPQIVQLIQRDILDGRGQKQSSNPVFNNH
ncbi:alpha/beta hydrolase [Oenococcus oeni]|uniref:alpha/beta hydrolase n=1 Tax=Oenococcus oeni TaxID=1247 RepID=UPI000BDF51C0|nr:alpha/beta hydrolase [Oenococcus oeni]PDH95051.1 acyltransferase [Oenococcus oeni]